MAERKKAHSLNNNNNDGKQWQQQVKWWATLSCIPSSALISHLIFLIKIHQAKISHLFYHYSIFSMEIFTKANDIVDIKCYWKELLRLLV